MLVEEVFCVEVIVLAILQFFKQSGFTQRQLVQQIGVLINFQHLLFVH